MHNFNTKGSAVNYTLNKNTILIVDDDNSCISFLVNLLKNDYTLFIAKNGEEAINSAIETKPDLILLDIIMPLMDGYQTLSFLKETDETSNIPVILISALSTTDDLIRGLSLDAVDYITKPLNEELVKIKIYNQIKIINTLRNIADLDEIDYLTGIASRKYLLSQLEIEWDKALREKINISLLIASLEGLKEFNNKYGYTNVDLLIKSFAQTIIKSIKRKSDLAARLSGGDFAVLLPQTNKNGAIHVAQKIKKNIESKEIIIDNNPILIKANIGFSSYVPSCDDSQKLIINATKALVIAKNNNKIASNSDILE